MKKMIFAIILLFNITGARAVENLDFQITKNLDFVNAADDIKKFWEDLQKNRSVKNIGKDQDFRHLYVGLQGVIEATLANSNLDVIGVIHTALPPTPLRTEGKVITEGLITPEIQNDPERLKTVLNRVNILPTYLAAGKKLYACYPKLSQDTKVPGMDIYLKKLALFAGVLIDKPFSGNLPAELSGATYIIQDKTGKKYYFGLLARQASAPDDNATWMMIYGPESDETVKDHVNKVMTFLENKKIKLD
jgi:hypothetical protein